MYLRHELDRNAVAREPADGESTPKLFSWGDSVNEGTHF